MAISQYKVVGDAIGAIGLSETQTTQAWPLGYQVQGVKQASGTADKAGWGRFVYVQGSDVSSAGRFVHLHNGSAVLLAAAASASAMQVGVACAALSATSLYGWAQVEGYCDFALGTNSSCGAGIPLYIAAGTAGVALSNAVAGNRIQGVVLGASYTSADVSMKVYLNGAAHVNGATAVL